MGIFSSDRSVSKLVHERLGAEWRALRNVYREILPDAELGSPDERLISEIVSLCDQISNAVNAGFQTFGNPKPDNILISSLMAKIVVSDSQLSRKPEKANRTNRLVGITNSILAGDFKRYFADSQGNHADWYRGL